jgi:hypothetical protein
MQNNKLSLLTFLTFATMGCQTLAPIHTVPYVDLNRFMGDWYVVANIPTFIEKDELPLLRLTRGALTDRSRHTIHADLFGIKNLTPYGACSSYGRLKRNTESFF